MNRKLTAIILCIFTIFLLTACSGGGPTYSSISADDAKGLMDNGGVTVIDMRSEEDYINAHIPGAINIPIDYIEDLLPDALPEMDDALLVYCSTDELSKQAAKELIDLGYTNVSEFGSFDEWSYDTISGSETGEWQTQNNASSSDEDDSAGIMGSFSTEDLDENQVTQDILSGYDLTMINVWATYCTPCISEMPVLKELSDEYANKGVQIIGLVSDVLNADGSFSETQIQTAKDIAEATGADYTHILPSQDLYHVIAQVSAVPTTFFVDNEGNLVGSAYAGARDKEDWEKIIDATMEEL